MTDYSNRRVLVRQPTPPRFETAPPSPVPAGVRVFPSSGPPGPRGPAGADASETTLWWTGNGVPDVVVGARPGDLYIDNLTGIYYRLD